MSINLRIPDSIARSLQLPGAEAEQRLRTKLAVALYAQGMLSFGKASELAGLSRYQFADIIGARRILRHYGEPELAEDLPDARRK